MESIHQSQSQSETSRDHACFVEGDYVPCMFSLSIHKFCLTQCETKLHATAADEACPVAQSDGAS